MICKNCGKEITWDLLTCRINQSQKFLSNSIDIPEIYNGYTDILVCGKCYTVIDYKDLPVERFLGWLNNCLGEQKDSENLKGKALIRYFGLDKLLGEKKDAGD